jgi:hypothetical protein
MFRHQNKFSVAMSAGQPIGSIDASLNIAMPSNGMKSNHDIATSMKLAAPRNVAAFTPSGNDYLDSLSMKNIEMKNYENFNQAKQFNTQQFLASQNQTQQMNEVTNLSKAQADLQQPVVAQAIEEVSFKVEKMEDKPVVISNHFAGDVTTSTQHSPLTAATTASFGQLLMNF